MIYKEKGDSHGRKDKGQLNPDAPGDRLFALRFEIVPHGGHEQNDGNDNEDDANDGFGDHQLFLCLLIDVI